jgi:hypothetical protein
MAMPDVGAQLEAAITDAGTLLVWAEKYRHGDGRLLDASRLRLLDQGDRARRLGRAGTLDGRTAQELLREVADTNQDLRRAIETARASTTYRRAVEARASGDQGTLVRLLPQIFADLRVTGRPSAVFWTPTWQRRGRPLPADVVGEGLRDLETTGVPSMNDDLIPGVDPELPGVLLSTTPPFGSPLAVRYEAAVLPETCLSLGDDQVLVPCDGLRLPFEVVLASPDEPLDEWVSDPTSYLNALEATCHRLGLSVRRMPTPAASF